MDFLYIFFLGPNEDLWEIVFFLKVFPIFKFLLPKQVLVYSIQNRWLHVASINCPRTSSLLTQIYVCSTLPPSLSLSHPQKTNRTTIYITPHIWLVFLVLMLWPLVKIVLWSLWLKYYKLFVGLYGKKANISGP